MLGLTFAPEPSGDPQRVFWRRLDLRSLLHVAQRGEAARNDRHLVHRLGARRELGDDRVAGLMKRDDAALFGVREAVLPLETDDNAIDGCVQFGHADFGFLAARRQQGGFVEHVLEIGAHIREYGAHIFQIDIARQFYLARVYLKDGMAKVPFGPIDEHLTGRSAGAQKGAVQISGRLVAAIDDAVARVEPSISTSS